MYSNLQNLIFGASLLFFGSFSQDVTICKQLQLNSNELNNLTKQCIGQTVFIHEIEKQNICSNSINKTTIQAMIDKHLKNFTNTLKVLENTISTIKLNNPELCYAGIKNHRIPNSAMTASSQYGKGYYAYYGRLDSLLKSKQEIWHAAPGNYRRSWLQVDFGNETRIVGVVTQGRRTFSQWVSSYKIFYGNSPASLMAIQSGGKDVVFQGNRDRTSHVTRYFPKPITARYFRLVVVTYNKTVALRMEYLLC